MSSYSPDVYDGTLAEFRDICNYWIVENMGYVSRYLSTHDNAIEKRVCLF